MTEGITTILALRIILLGAGAVLCYGAAMKATFRAYNLPPSEIRTFFQGLGASIVLIGTVLIGFAIGDIFKYTTGDAWADTFGLIFGFIGALGIFLFVWTIWKITRFVAGK